MKPPHRHLHYVSISILALLVAFMGFAISSAQSDARQTPPNLESLKQRLLPLFMEHGVVFTDADEQAGRLVVGIDNPGIARAVRARLAALGISQDEVDIVPSEPIMRVASLQDEIRPVAAGLQINFSGYVCSVGFNATLGGVAGFVTASHCTDQQGGTENTQYYQPLGPAYGLNGTLIANESEDPAYTSGNCGSSMPGKLCRLSDSSFERYAADVPYSLGFIEKTTGANNGSLTISGSFTITGETNAGLGTVVNKVGRTTGWTQAPVSRTCTDTGVSGTNIVLLCQTWVTSTSSVIVKGGDSGSGVFVGTSNVSLAGILWGGSSGGKTFVFSPLSQVEQDLGNLTVTAAGTPSPTPTETPTPTLTPTPSVGPSEPTPTPTPGSCPPGQHKRGKC